MFNPDFYPTPPEIIDFMVSEIDLHGKVILEPSAGKGNIVDALKTFGAKQVLTFEKEPDLQRIVTEKSTLLGDDFLSCTKDQVSHIDAIIANPPFSTGGKHILHMWKIAPEGCEIVALCNSNTLHKDFTRERRELNRIIQDYGKFEDLGDCFSQSERKTNVEISLIRLFKPVLSEEKNWDGFFMDEDEESVAGIGIMAYNEVRSIVNRYVAAVKLFDQYSEVSDQMNFLLKPVGLNDGFSCQLSYGKAVKTKEDFSRELQKESWKWIFKQMNVGKYVTSGVMEDINKFVEEQQKYPFTMKNIYRMFEIIIGTREQTMNRALVEVFDKLTKHHHDNRYQVEGWKTNSHYLVNKKFILEGCVDYDSRWPSQYVDFRYGSYGVNKMNDLHKALCYLTGSGEELDLARISKREDKWEFGTWYDWGFFEVKGFKKRTLHCKFKDEKVWAMFNRKIAEIKGFPLPEKL